MHRPPVTLAVLATLCVALVRPAVATGPCAVASDVTGDVVLAGQAATSGLVPDDAVDLTGLSVATAGGDLVLTIALASLDRPVRLFGEGAGAPVPAEWSASFTVNGHAWRAGADGGEWLGLVTTTGPALFWAGTGGTYTEVSGAYDTAAGTVTVRIPLGTLGAATGDTVSAFSAHAKERFVTAGEWDAKLVEVTASDDATSVQGYTVGATC